METRFVSPHPARSAPERHNRRQVVGSRSKTRKNWEIGAENSSQNTEGSVGVGDIRGDITVLLAGVKRGERDALDQLLPLVYRELHRMASQQMRAERPGHTLQPTALVNEAFLRLVDQGRVDWQNRAQFFAVASQLMRRLLVDHARRRAAAKRGVAIALTEEILNRPVVDRTEEILAVDDVLGRLTELDPRQAQIVELRYFGGLSVEETAEAMGVSPRTVKADWAMAKGWLRSQLADRGAA